jgi:hypothetical protein
MNEEKNIDQTSKSNDTPEDVNENISQESSLNNQKLNLKIWKYITTPTCITRGKTSRNIFWSS